MRKLIKASYEHLLFVMLMLMLKGVRKLPSKYKRWLRRLPWVLKGEMRKLLSILKKGVRKAAPALTAMAVVTAGITVTMPAPEASATALTICSYSPVDIKLASGQNGSGTTRWLPAGACRAYTNIDSFNVGSGWGLGVNTYANDGATFIYNGPRWVNWTSSMTRTITLEAWRR